MIDIIIIASIMPDTNSGIAAAVPANSTKPSIIAINNPINPKIAIVNNVIINDSSYKYKLVCALHYRRRNIRDY